MPNTPYPRIPNIITKTSFEILKNIFNQEVKKKKVISEKEKFWILVEKVFPYHPSPDKRIKNIVNFENE